MSIDTSIASDVMARMQESAEKAAKGIRDPDGLQQAFAEMNRLREALRRRIGTIDVSVELLREARDQ